MKNGSAIFKSKQRRNCNFLKDMSIYVLFFIKSQKVLQARSIEMPADNTSAFLFCT